jgi:DNA-damage-inducible protein D
MYGGLGRKEIKRKKNISESEELLDCAGRAELAANEFKASQTEQKLIRDHIEGQQQAIDTHYRVGNEVRATIKRIGGTMPEDLPAEESIKRLTTERRVKPTPRLL